MASSDPPKERRSGTRRAANAITDQFVVAGTSFVLMLLVRRQLGSGALGTYALLINAMILVTALHTAWVGDTLTVLDRSDDEIRAGLFASMWSFAALSFVISTALAFTVINAQNAVLFGVMVTLWGVEEIGRRVLMARFEFGGLVINDFAYTVGAVAFVILAWSSRGALTLTIVLIAMFVGAVTSIAVLLVQLPREEFRWVSPSFAAAKKLFPFAVWRSAQMGIRPLAQFAVRSLVFALASRAAAGDLESARLLSQPAMTYVSGVASLLLPMYAAEERTRTRSVSLSAMTALLTLPVAAYAALVTIFRGKISLRIFDDVHAVAAWAMLGWLMIALLFAAGQPVANLLIARKQARALFAVRAFDSFVGLVIAYFVIKYYSVNAAPWALSVGMLLGTLGLVALVNRKPPERIVEGMDLENHTIARTPTPSGIDAR